MRALVMAAGLGTRLKPLTNHIPKPLVPVRGKPMVEYVLDNLARAGVPEALINIHYLPAQMRDFVDAWNVRGGVPRLTIQDESGEILGSGGGVAKAAPWLFEQEQAAIVCNSDVIATPDLLALVKEHKRLRDAHGVECTLSLVADEGAGVKYTGVREEKGLITSFERPGKHEPGLWHFPGFYVIESSGAKRLPPAGTVSSIMGVLWKNLVAERKLGAWIYKGSYRDVGTVDDLKAAEAEL